MKQKNNFNKFLLLWFGEFVSSIGSGLTAFGLGVYIFKVTGSAASMSLVGKRSPQTILIAGGAGNAQGDDTIAYGIELFVSGLQ